MSRPPRDPRRPILTPVLARRIGIVSVMLLAAAFGLFELELASGRAVAEARTVAVTVFIVMESVYLFNCRSLERSPFALGFFSNPWMFAGVGAMLLLQVAFVYLPVMNRLFSTASFGLAGWLEIIGASLLAYLVIEGEKWWQRRRAGPGRPQIVFRIPGATCLL